jgi:hypothetical protein
MISEKVQKEIDSARRFGQQLEELVYRRGQCPTGDRDVLLIAYWALVFDYHKAILSLLPAELFGAAFALVRPVIEVTVRAHFAIFCSQEDLVNIQQDEYRVNFKTIGPQIDSAFGLGTFMKDFLTGASKALHSYTHGGILQVGRRFDGSDLKPRYSEGEVIEVIHTTTSAAFMVTNIVTKHFKFEEEWKRTTEMFVEWGKH